MRSALGLIVLLLVFCVGAPSALADEPVVKVGHSKVDPAMLQVAPGTTVTFHNLDEMPGGHTIVADDGSFESPAMAKDERWSHTFDKAGSYPYSIKQHPSAKGRIVVE